MDKLTEDYINIDERLEYMKAIAVEYAPAPDIDTDPETGERYVCGTTALQFFIPRYNENKLHECFTYDSYIANQDIQSTLQGLGIDTDKFWFLLLFILDYTHGTCSEGMKGYGIGIEQLKEAVNAIVDNHERITSYGVTFKKPITITVEIEDEKKIVIDSPDAIADIAASIINSLNEIEDHPWMQNQRVTFTHVEEKLTVRIWMFYKMFQDFFNLPPYKELFKHRRKKGTTLSLSKIFLISKLINLTKLSENTKFSDSDENLRGYISLHKETKINTANSIY